MIRLPKDLRDRVGAQAERNKRTFNAELLSVIERGLAGDMERLADPKTRAAVKARAGACDHPRGRVIKGFCYRCGKPTAI